MPANEITREEFDKRVHWFKQFARKHWKHSEYVIDSAANEITAYADQMERRALSAELGKPPYKHPNRCTPAECQCGITAKRARLAELAEATDDAS